VFFSFVLDSIVKGIAFSSECGCVRPGNATGDEAREATSAPSLIVTKPKCMRAAQGGQTTGVLAV
jgi:hypothetical protein